jgi:Fe-S cluster assembly ATP-binding protein
MQRNDTMSELLRIEDLTAGAPDKELLHGVTLSIGTGETHVLMGPNGAGKSTLGCTLMGSPEYTITGGRIFFEGEDITDEPADKRAKRGIFLSFQNPIEIAGISLSEFLRNALEQIT